LKCTSIDEAIEAAKSGFARIEIGLLKNGGEELLARDAITVRCLMSADMGLPRGHDDPDAVAVVGRSY
jgi:prolyl-tRNA synthetase